MAEFAVCGESSTIAAQLHDKYADIATRLKLGFRAIAHNCNGIGTVCGGVLMAFADYTATMLALSDVKENCITISFSSDFIAAARLGDWVEGEGDVVKRTGSMTFIHGRLWVANGIVLGFQTAMRRLKKPTA